MSRLRHNRRHNASVIIFLATMATTTLGLQCSSPEVTYREHHLSGSHNKTGIWKTTLGNIKVVVEHFSKPLSRSMGTGHWEVNIKMNSTVCAQSDKNDEDALFEEMTPEHVPSSEWAVSAPSTLNNPPLSEDAAAYQSMEENEKLSDTDGINSETIIAYTDEKLVTASHRFSGRREMSPTSTDGLLRDVGSNYNSGNTEDRTEEFLSNLSDPLPKRPTHQEYLRQPDIVSSDDSNRRDLFQAWSHPGYVAKYDGYGKKVLLKLFAESLPWKLAKQRCEEDGAHLASVDTEHRVAALLDLFSVHPRIARTSVLKNQVYVGMNDRDQEGEFRTATGELFSPWNASVWFPNEPDDANGGEDCVTFHKMGKIRDVPCHFSLPFFCEVDEETASELR